MVQTQLATDSVKAAFLFLDECHSAKLNLAALTGVLVPVEAYADVRDEVCRIVWHCMKPETNTIPVPIELHASALLNELGGARESVDALRLSVFEETVKIVNKYGLHVCRIAYTNHKEVAAVLTSDPKLYGFMFFGIQRWLGPIMADTLVIPVMDGIPDTSTASKPPRVDAQLVRAFSASIRWIHQYRCSGYSTSNISIDNTPNLGEPLYGDSAYSTLLQLVDLVSYLLHQVEKAELNRSTVRGAFSQAVLASARLLDGSLVHRWQGELELKPTV